MGLDRRKASAIATLSIGAGFTTFATAYQQKVVSLIDTLHVSIKSACWKIREDTVDSVMGSNGKLACRINNPGALARAICPYIVPE